MQAFEADDSGDDEDHDNGLIITPNSKHWPKMFGDLMVE